MNVNKCVKNSKLDTGLLIFVYNFKRRDRKRNITDLSTPKTLYSKKVIIIV